ncbi:MAG TPA: c-type cytochrome [Burkholderiaceae bacterium]
MKKLFQITAALLLIAAGSAQADVVGKAEDGAKKAQMCIGCHGIHGYRASFPEIHQVPMIAGQNPKYIAAALEAYAKGERKHPTMRGIATSLKEQDIADLAAFYAGQAQVEPAATIPAAPAAIAAKVAVCVACHGVNFSKPVTGAEPKLAGQHADYLFVALKSYQTTDNALVGRGNAIMAGQVKELSHADLKAIASYIGSLPGEVRTVPETRLR